MYRLVVQRGAGERRVVMPRCSGVSETGEQKVLGLEVCESEDDLSFWKGSSLEDLRDRGFAGVKLVCSGFSPHWGLNRAISEVFLGASCQRRRVHIMHSLLVPVPKDAQVMMLGAMCLVFQPPDKERVRLKSGRSPVACRNASAGGQSPSSKPESRSWSKWISPGSTALYSPPLTCSSVWKRSADGSESCASSPSGKASDAWLARSSPSRVMSAQSAVATRPKTVLTTLLVPVPVRRRSRP